LFLFLLSSQQRILFFASSTAVQKAGGKETFEFIALKKASELAEKKKALQLQVYRNATAKKYVSTNLSRRLF